MEVAPAFVHLNSYMQATTRVLLSFTLSLHTHVILRECLSHFPS